VAVSTGLLQRHDREEVEAVIGHEVAHIANGDMVTMTLIQGVMNTFVVFLSRVIGYAVDSFLRKNERAPAPASATTITTIVLDIVLGFVAAIIVAWFSASANSAPTPAPPADGPQAAHDQRPGPPGRLHPGELPKSVAAMGIAGGIGKLFSTHPPIEERIAALQRHGFAHLDAVHARRQNAAGVARPFARRVQAAGVQALQVVAAVMRSGDEVRVSTPVSTASGMS
jgi:heat shock protein HtpX